MKLIPALVDMDDCYDVGTPVQASDGKLTGSICGRGFHCRLESCSGLRIPVRWPDGRRTYPCTKGMFYIKGTWRIA